jgi:hypothetical protein
MQSGTTRSRRFSSSQSTVQLPELDNYLSARMVSNTIIKCHGNIKLFAGWTAVTMVLCEWIVPKNSDVLTTVIKTVVFNTVSKAKY